MRKRNKRRHPSSEVHQIVDERRASRAQAALECEGEVASRAKAFFNSHVADVLRLDGDERARQLFFLHRDALCVSYTDVTGSSLDGIPVSMYDELDPGSARAAFPWVIDVVRAHSAAALMTEQQFGALMAGGFSNMYNVAVRDYNALVTASPFHTTGGPIRSAAAAHDYVEMRRRMTPQQNAEYEEAESRWANDKQTAQRIAMLWKQFCYAYSAYDSMLAQSLD